MREGKRGTAATRRVASLNIVLAAWVDSTPDCINNGREPDAPVVSDGADSRSDGRHCVARKIVRGKIPFEDNDLTRVVNRRVKSFAYLVDD